MIKYKNYKIIMAISLICFSSLGVAQNNEPSQQSVTKNKSKVERESLQKKGLPKKLQNTATLNNKAIIKSKTLSSEESNVKTAKILLNQAIDLAQNYQTKKAINLLERALNLDESNFYISDALITLYIMQDNYSGANNIVQKIKRNDENFWIQKTYITEKLFGISEALRVIQNAPREFHQANLYQFSLLMRLNQKKQSLNFVEEQLAKPIETQEYRVWLTAKLVNLILDEQFAYAKTFYTENKNTLKFDELEKHLNEINSIDEEY